MALMWSLNNMIVWYPRCTKCGNLGACASKEEAETMVKAHENIYHHGKPISDKLNSKMSEV